MHLARSSYSLLLLCCILVCTIPRIDCSEYLGCYSENTDGSGRLMKGARQDYPENLTTTLCISFCSSKGFAYAGVQYRVECFCSNERPLRKSFAKDAECDMKCPGDVREYCGGSNRINVYATGKMGGSKYIGCFKEKSAEARLLPELRTEFRKELTPAKCIAHCKEKGFDFAAVEFRYECFCSNTKPHMSYSVEEKDCDQSCEGDVNQICGGSDRLGVYHTSEVLTNFVEENYVGCYTDNENSPTLNGKVGGFPSRLTPELCVAYCFRYGARYAGLQNGTQCFCGNYLDERQRTSESPCNYKCPNKRFNCGGRLTNAVYHTSISDYSEDGKFLGCFVDQPLRTLSAIQIFFDETNTPKLCVNVCLQLGFKYAGVEYGAECFCGNKKPPSNLETGEQSCAMPCPGDKRQNCGGIWRLLIYSTDVNQNKDPNNAQGSTARPNSVRNIAAPSANKPTTTGNRNTNTNPSKNCEQSSTEVNRKKVCKGELLFKEDFTTDISSDKWTHEVKMPWIPDYEFVVFQKRPENSFVKNGKLHIKPTLQPDDVVRRGTLDLKSCTGIPYSEECVRQAATFSILPPISSARISTKDSISFKYGIVQVRAKLPQGDWIVPEIWLEPKRSVYGSSYASGRIRIAMSRGNRNLISGDADIGNRVLESGVLMGVGEYIRGRTVMRDKADGWSRTFQNYTLIWTPDNIKFMVDGDHEESIISPGATLSDLLEFDDKTAVTWKSGSRIAPFDQEFYLSLGITVGGMRDFADDSISSTHVKPWRNMAVKAMVNFWKDRSNWKSTWNDDKSGLQVEHVRIYAL